MTRDWLRSYCKSVAPAIALLVAGQLQGAVPFGDHKQFADRVDPQALAVDVFVEMGSPISESVVRTTAELRLRIAGLTVVPLEELDDAHGLAVWVSAVEAQGAYIYEVSVSYWRPTLSMEACVGSAMAAEMGAARDTLGPDDSPEVDRSALWESFHGHLQLALEKAYRGPVWSRGTYGIVGESLGPEQTVKNAIEDLVDEFLNEYLTAYPSLE